MTPEEQAELLGAVERDRAERERAAFIRSAGEPPKVDTRLSFDAGSTTDPGTYYLYRRMYGTYPQRIITHPEPTERPADEQLREQLLNRGPFTKTQNLPQPDVSEPTEWLSTPHTNTFAAAADAWARMAASASAPAWAFESAAGFVDDWWAERGTYFDEAADFLNGGHQDGDPVDEGPIPGDKEPTQRVFTGELPTDIIDAGATGRPWSPTEAEILADPDDAVEAIDQLAQLAPVHAPWLTITTRTGSSAVQPITIGYQIPSITTMPA